MKRYRIYNWDYSVGKIGTYNQCVAYCKRTFSGYMVNTQYFINRIHEVCTDGRDL